MISHCTSASSSRVFVFNAVQQSARTAKLRSSIAYFDLMFYFGAWMQIKIFSVNRYDITKSWLDSLNDGAGAKLIMTLRKNHQHGDIKSFTDELSWLNVLLVGLNDEVSTINCNESTNNQKWRHVASIVFSLNSSAVVLHQCKSSYYQRLLFVTSLLSAWNWILCATPSPQKTLKSLISLCGCISGFRRHFCCTFIIFLPTNRWKNSVLKHPSILLLPYEMIL